MGNRRHYNEKGLYNSKEIKNVRPKEREQSSYDYSRSRVDREYSEQFHKEKNLGKSPEKQLNWVTYEIVPWLQEAKSAVADRFGSADYVQANHILARRRMWSLIDALSDEQKLKLGEGLGIKHLVVMEPTEQYQELCSCASNIFLGLDRPDDNLRDAKSSIDPVYLQVEGKHINEDIKVLDIRAELYIKNRSCYN